MITDQGALIKGAADVLSWAARSGDREGILGPALAQESGLVRESFLAPIRARLTCMHTSCILICMRTTLNIDDRLLDEARGLSGIEEKTALVRAGLEALIARESARRLGALGGTERNLRKIPRRRARTIRKPA